MDNLSANKTPAVRAWAARHKVEPCLTPTYASWANPIEAQFGPLRTFTMGASDHRNHPALARRMQAYLRWRNTHARHPACSPRNAENEPESAANANIAGADHERHDPVNVHGQRTSGRVSSAGPVAPPGRCRNRRVAQAVAIA
jgi:hypothetical protein